VSDWGIKPWNIDKLTAKDLQDIALAEHAEAYIKEQSYEQQRTGQRSSRNSSNYQDFKSNMKDQYGSV